MITETPRLKLKVDASGEGLVDTLSGNWDRVDKAAGIMYTTKGVDIPNVDLYPGAIVAERDTGITWQCTSVGDGTYTKRYISYPFFLRAFHSGGAPAGSILNHGWTALETDQSVNAGPENLNSGDGTWSFVPPIKGLYVGRIQMRWQAWSLGERASALTINNVVRYDTEESLTYHQHTEGTYNIKIRHIFNPTDQIRCMHWNGSPDHLGFFHSIHIQMLRPG